ncbi:hypothetical protein [Pseudoalteromonas sp. GB56]
MMKLISVVCVLIFCVDFIVRVLPDDPDRKTVVASSVNYQAVTFDVPEKPDFNDSLFGKVAQEEIKTEEKVAEKPKAEDPAKALNLLAIYTQPEAYVFAALKKSQNKTQKLKVGEKIGDFTLTSISQSSATFDLAGKSYTFTMFKTN